MAEDMCHRGARDGCGAANLGDDLKDRLTGGMDREEAEKVMDRIDESWKRKNLKSGASHFGFDKPEEFQLALTLAIMGHEVMSRNDDQHPPHAGDAWVDDKRAEFKVQSSTSRERLKKHIKHADRDQQVEVVYVDLRPSGMSQGDAESITNHYSSYETLERIVVIGKDWVIDKSLKD
ncbi:hypothetical protein [Streptomyces sp. NPDC060198]|uniref:hypothetical protein n=1 Tax=Streptomyces sp. NPDC060198 TaxID=3347070 RepID=UPI00364E730D